MMTDVLELKERGIGVSCINLSCGYYEPHTDEEFTVKKDLLNCLRLVEHIIENCLSVYPHENLDTGYYGIDAETEIWDILNCDPEISAEFMKCTIQIIRIWRRRILREYITILMN